MGRVAAAMFAFPFIFSISLAAEEGWNRAELPHFTVFHQSPRRPGKFDLNMGRIHQCLAFDLSMFSPWMTKEKINIYLYRDQKAYADGEFSPPPWSNGLAVYDKRAVLVYERPGDRKTAERRLMELIAHESTHLYFGSYWAELGRIPPSWLNEGLAMVEEVGSLGRAEASGPYQAMLDLPGREIPLSQFFALAPTKDLTEEKDKQEVQRFYAQAYSIVFFLLRQHSTRQFKELNEQLRQGLPVAEAVAKAYKYPTLERFRTAWLSWLKQPSHRRRVAAAQRAEAKAASLTPQLPQGFQTKWR